MNQQERHQEERQSKSSTTTTKKLIRNLPSLAKRLAEVQALREMVHVEERRRASGKVGQTG